MDRYKVVNGDYVALIDKILKQNLNTLLCSNNFSKNESSAMTNKDGRCEVTYSENRIKHTAVKDKAKIQNNSTVLSKTEKRTVQKEIKEEDKGKNRGIYVFLGLMLFFIMIFLDIFSEYVFLLFFIAVIYFSIRKRAKQQKE